MQARFLTILILLLQPMAVFPVGASQALMPESASACCEMIVRTSCCNKPVVKTQCGMTIEACDCGISPGDSEPQPAAPMPGQGVEIQTVVDGDQPNFDASRASNSFSILKFNDPDPVPGHNRVRALLGIWRT